MKTVMRRLLAAAAVMTALLIGTGATMAQAAPSPSPTVSSTASSAAASPSSSATPEADDANVEVSADTASDNTRNIWVLGGSALVAVVAAAVVIARR